jgi:hypothetical protein
MGSVFITADLLIAVQDNLIVVSRRKRKAILPFWKPKDLTVRQPNCDDGAVRHPDRMKLNFKNPLASVLGMAILAAAYGQEPNPGDPLFTQTSVDPYFGDYVGTYTASETPAAAGGPAPVAAEAKVVPQGNRAYRIVLDAKALDPKGLPMQIELPGHVDGERVVVGGTSGGHDWDGEVSAKTLRVSKHGYGGVFEMKQVMKQSPTEGLKPPPGALVLLAFDPGHKPGLDQWQESGWVATDDGILHKNPGDGPRGDLRTRREFRNVRLHVEFRIPYEPDKREQGRGNSGVIFADRYEVQVLDSYGLITGAGDCAAIYGVAPPRINAAFPPLSWQTYDITFHAARMDGGKMVHGPRFTVLWNGVKVHENQTSATPTGDPNRPNADVGPIRLQDHGNLVYFRNIWVQVLPDSAD